MSEEGRDEAQPRNEMTPCRATQATTKQPDARGRRKKHNKPRKHKTWSSVPATVSRAAAGGRCRSQVLVGRAALLAARAGPWLAGGTIV